MAIMSIIHVAAVHWSEQKFIIIIRGAHAPGRAVGDVYVYPQYTGFIAICAARSYAVQQLVYKARLWYFGYVSKRISCN